MDQRMHLEFAGKSARIMVAPLRGTKAAQPTLRTSRGTIQRQRLTNGAAVIDPTTIAADALMEGDPELNLELVATPLEDAVAAYFDPRAQSPVPIGDFSQTEIVFDVQGHEKERRAYVPKSRNLDATTPIKIARRMPLDKALTQFVFRDVHQLVHTDGLTFDFLHALANDLHVTRELALIGAGPKGAVPVVVRERGTPCRAFLYGEIDETGERYRLLMLLSEQELKLVQT